MFRTLVSLFVVLLPQVSSTVFAGSCDNCGWFLPWSDTCRYAQYGDPNRGRRYLPTGVGNDYTQTCVEDGEVPPLTVEHSCTIAIGTPMHAWYEPSGGSFGIDFSVFKDKVAASAGLDFNWEETMSFEATCGVPISIPPGDCGPSLPCYKSQEYTQFVFRRAIWRQTGKTVKHCRWVRTWYGYMKWQCDDVPTYNWFFCEPCEGTQAVGYVGLHCVPATRKLDTHAPPLKQPCK